MSKHTRSPRETFTIRVILHLSEKNVWLDPGDYVRVCVCVWMLQKTGPWLSPVLLVLCLIASPSFHNWAITVVDPLGGVTLDLNLVEW